jgi:hypothetical protein
MGDVMRVHDGPDPSLGIGSAGRTSEEQVLGHQEMADGEAQFVHHRASTGAEVLDGRAKDVIGGREEGFGVHIERVTAAGAEAKAVEGGSQAVNVQKKAEEPEAERKP